MANRTGAMDATAFVFFAPGRRSIRTCPTSTEGATEWSRTVGRRATVDVVGRGSETGNESVPPRCRAGDAGGPVLAH